MPFPFNRTDVSLAGLRLPLQLLLKVPLAGQANLQPALAVDQIAYRYDLAQLRMLQSRRVVAGRHRAQKARFPS